MPDQGAPVDLGKEERRRRRACAALLAVALATLGGGDAFAVNHPFGSHPMTYAAGTIRPNHVTQAVLDEAVRDFYDEWKDEYLEQACEVGFAEGLLPHTNAGILSAAEMQRLRRRNASMGLMLETTSLRVRARGGAHYWAPDKDPQVRLRMHEEAGLLRIPFTSGILLGIGEDADERVDTLFAIRDLHAKYGHVQEVIVQPFHPKPGTPMAEQAALSDAEVAGWVALARLVLGPEMNVQAPPNLAPDALELLLRAGANDWGGVSPVTVDFINPEAPWPTLGELRRRTEAAGARLVERLPVYPAHLADPSFFEPAVREAALRRAGPDGYALPAPSLEAA